MRAPAYQTTRRAVGQVPTPADRDSTTEGGARMLKTHLRYVRYALTALSAVGFAACKST